MVQKYVLPFLLSILPAATLLAFQDSIPAYKGYALVWHDEFDKSGTPDALNWNFENGFVRNNELQWYQQENARCENGMLIIEGKKESKPNPNYKEEGRDWRQKRRTIEYTAASMKTQGLKSWMYGRFEMRGRIDVSSGIWPAWWTLGVKGRWPHNGEIDIMEYYRGNLLANIATGDSAAYKAKWFSTETPVRSLGADWSSKFHIWRMDWSRDSISLYVDGKLLNCVAMNKLVNRDGSGTNPFMQEHYMLLNLAIGGDNGGDPSNTSFPRRFEVDYVRVWQKNN
jgi:beta-glucanase (GH16 family)